MPILDRLAGLLIHRDGLQLGQGNPEGSAVPADQNEHLVFALLLGGHSDDLDLVAHPQRRDAALGDAPSHKREAQSVLERVVPAHGLIFGHVGVDDDLHGDALLSLLVAGWSLHQASCLLLWTIAGHGRQRNDHWIAITFSLAGGPGRRGWGGVVLPSSISDVVNLLGVSAWYPQLLKGAIILLGAAAYAGRREVARESAPAP
jgi:hypothetical protein